MKKLTSARWSKLTSVVINHVDGVYSWYDVMRMMLYPCGLPPQNPQFHFNHELPFQLVLKNQTNPKWRTFYKIPDQYWKPSRSKTKSEELLLPRWA